MSLNALLEHGMRDGDQAIHETYEGSAWLRLPILLNVLFKNTRFAQKTGRLAAMALHATPFERVIYFGSPPRREKPG